MEEKEIDVAITVRMGFRSLLDMFFVMGALLYFVIIGIPDVMHAYSEYTPWLGIPAAAFFCMFLWRLGKMMVTYVQTYLDMRDLHTDVVVVTKGLAEKIVMGGKIKIHED